MERKLKSGRTLEEKSFLEHLEDLRWMFLKIALSWGFLSLLAFLISPRILTIIQWPFSRMLRGLGEGRETAFILKSFSPAEVFLVTIKLSLLAGFICALPLILYWVAQFILPALKPDEKRYLAPSFLIGGGLFFSGVLFSYWLVLPLSLRFFWGFSERMGIQPFWSIGFYTSLVGKLLLAFGLMFEIPVIILLLAKLGIVNYTILSQKRPYVIVGMFIMAALLTPPDVVTQLLLAIPMIVLYEICVFFSKFFSAKIIN